MSNNQRPQQSTHTQTQLHNTEIMLCPTTNVPCSQHTHSTHTYTQLHNTQIMLCPTTNVPCSQHTHRHSYVTHKQTLMPTNAAHLKLVMSTAITSNRPGDLFTNGRTTVLLCTPVVWHWYHTICYSQKMSVNLRHTCLCRTTVIADHFIDCYQL